MNKCSNLCEKGVKMVISEIISIASACLFAIITIITNVITLCKKNKKTKVLEILSNIPSYVSQAEQIFGSGNGQAKLQWVLTKVQIDSVKANVDISEEEATSQIESVLQTPQKKEVEQTSQTV